MRLEYLPAIGIAEPKASMALAHAHWAILRPTLAEVPLTELSFFTASVLAHHGQRGLDWQSTVSNRDRRISLPPANGDPAIFLGHKLLHW